MREKERVIVLVLALVILIGTGILFYSTNKKTAKKTGTTTPTTAELTPTTPPPTPTPELLRYDYIITEITEKEVKLQTTRGGTAFFPKDEGKIKVYKGEPGEAVEASLSDLKVGQKLKIKRIPGRLLEVYILK